MDTGLDFQRIREEIDKQPWEQSDEPDREERRLFLGTVFALTPSGKFYTPWANNNVTEEEADRDIEWYDAVSAELEKLGLYLQHGEGDPCDLFAAECRDLDVTCRFCRKDVNSDAAHLHQGEYVGECCWDERLKITE